MTWQSPPNTLYTRTQVRARAEEVRAQVESRTTKRSQESVDEAVYRFRDLLASPLRQDLAVMLIWFAKGNGEIGHGAIRADRLAEYLEYTCPAAFPEVLALDASRLWRGWEAGGGQYGRLGWKPQPAPGLLVVQYKPNYTYWALKAVQGDGHEQVVRDFQLMPTQLDYLMQALGLDHRGKTKS